MYIIYLYISIILCILYIYIYLLYYVYYISIIYQYIWEAIGVYISWFNINRVSLILIQFNQVECLNYDLYVLICLHSMILVATGICWSQMVRSKMPRNRKRNLYTCCRLNLFNLKKKSIHRAWYWLKYTGLHHDLLLLTSKQHRTSNIARGLLTRLIRLQFWFWFDALQNGKMLT